ncbi:hypothetical protein C9I99_09145 [Photobacterium lutimaris]|uniref:Uncharacterized protein n=1 Tax=Photobacterium lutimaris TaxID=388278 RepID=A0A2T3IZL5_9GAMM|nr:hypothetical protein C9I99_09145 [Photobacterium lutimaris]TDR75723.1 hypothetical protein DFP78_10480 [Photobacterium lutimaris]
MILDFFLKHEKKLFLGIPTFGFFIIALLFYIEVSVRYLFIVGFFTVCVFFLLLLVHPFIIKERLSRENKNKH